MAITYTPKLSKKEPFFHLRRVWLSMAWAGLLGEQNRMKAQIHIEAWQEYTRHGH